MLRSCFVAVLAAALPACTGADDTAGPADDSPIDPVDPPPTSLSGSAADSGPPTTPARIVAAIDDASGGRVEIYEPAGPNEISVGVGAQYPSPPPVTGEFVRSHDPIEVFLAVAPIGTAVPAALREAYPKLTVRDDAANRARLHAELGAQLAAFPKFDEPRDRSGSCTPSFINWFNGVYHDMPGGEDGTCSAQGPEAFHAEADVYKKGNGPGYIPIIAETEDGCAMQASSCDRWDLSYRDWQFGFENLYNNWEGHQSNRHDMHTGMMTCAGTATFHREWGGQSWDINLAAGHGWQQWVGSFPYESGPAAGLSGGVWDIAPPPHWAKTEVTNNAATGDRVIWCGNLEDQWSINDTGCNNWCDFDDSDGTSCHADYCRED